MKTKEELQRLKDEVETVDIQLAELTQEELAEIYGGVDFGDNSMINFNDNNINSSGGEVSGGIIFNS